MAIPDLAREQVRGMFGKVPDVDIARQFGIQPYAVRKWRQDAGVPPKRPEQDPLEEYRARVDGRYPGMVAQMGVVRDADIARKYGITRARVGQIRERLNIEAVSPPDVPGDIIALLGVLPDKDIASRFGIAAKRIRGIREQMGIPVAAASPYEAAIDAVRHRVGVDSDHQIAKDLGIPSQRIFAYRHRHGIPAARISPRCADFVKLDRDAIRRRVEEGATDEEIAAAMGSTRASIALIRCRDLKLYRDVRRTSG